MSAKSRKRWKNRKRRRAKAIIVSGTTAVRRHGRKTGNIVAKKRAAAGA